MAVRTSSSQVTQEKIHIQENSSSDFQPLIKSFFNYVSSSNPFDNFRKKSGIFCSSLCFLYMNKLINVNSTGKGRFPINRKKTAKSNRNKCKEEILLLFLYPLVKDSTIKKTSKAVQKQNKQVALKVAEEEAQRSSTNSMKCPACIGTDHARFSSSKCLYHVKNKVEVHQGFTKASVIKANLNNICKNANLILEIQKLVLHISQGIWASSMFANYL